MNGKNQTLSVHVVAFRKAAKLPVELIVSPTLLNLAHLEDCEVTIKWHLETKGFHFPTDGTAIEFTSPGAEKIFSKAEVSECKRFVTVHSKVADGLAYAYSVSVIDEATGLTAILDPVVQNRNK